MDRDNFALLQAGPRTRIFWALTVAYLGAVLLGAWTLGYFDSKGKPLAQQAWGDVLAGVFAPLAFLWLIYASLAQRAELELQRAELRRNNDAQEAQQAEMKRQADLLASQLRQTSRQTTAIVAQHKQMQRQADSMAAQAERLSREHYAQYEPIFVLRAIEMDSKAAMIFLLNVGNDALDVTLSAPYSPRSITSNDGNPRALYGPIPHWPRGTTVSIAIVGIQSPQTSFPPLTIFLTRLDRSEIVLGFSIDSEKRKLTYGNRIERLEPPKLAIERST